MFANGQILNYSLLKFTLLQDIHLSSQGLALGNSSSLTQRHPQTCMHTHTQYTVIVAPVTNDHCNDATEQPPAMSSEFLLGGYLTASG